MKKNVILYQIINNNNNNIAFFLNIEFRVHYFNIVLYNIDFPPFNVDHFCLQKVNGRVM